ncbi:unnamed protein product [Aphanomyces euteiches]
MVGLFSKNRAEWILTEIACNCMSYVVVPLYDTLGPKVVPFIINHTNMRVLVASGDLVPSVLKAKDESPTLEYIISMDSNISATLRSEAERKGVTVMTFEELEKVPNATVPPSPPKSSDLSTICYTSGTTGDPKGAILTHRNCTTAAMLLSERAKCHKDMVYISYLPLPHVMERAVATVVAYLGASMGFYQGDVQFLMDDMAELKPHLFVSVPRLFNRVYDKINSHSLWDALVFSKIKAVLGGRVEVIVSGSAPLSANVKEFMKIAFCCRVEEGYGLTECVATATLSHDDIPSGPHTGIPIANMQIRLADVREMNYTSADIPRPRGEICIRGPTVFAGRVQLYIAAEKIENIYIKSPFIAQIFLYGDSYQSCLVAIVVPDPEIVQDWAAKKNVPDGNNLAKMVTRPDLKADILASMAEMARNAELNGFECAKDIHLHHEAFSVENDLATPTFKLKRPQLKAYFQAQIDGYLREKSANWKSPKMSSFAVEGGWGDD